MELRDSNAPIVPDFTGPPASVTALIQNITSSMSVFGYNDEYDPLKPNDYEKLKEQNKREQLQRDRELENQRSDENEPKRGLYDEYENEDKEFTDRPIRKGNVFAPPPSLIEEDKRATGSSHPTESGLLHYHLSFEKHIPFDIDMKDEYPTTPPFNSDEPVEDMETESATPNPGFGLKKGYIGVFFCGMEKLR